MTEGIFKRATCINKLSGPMKNSAFDNNAADSRIEATPANLETLLNDGSLLSPK